MLTIVTLAAVLLSTFNAAHALKTLPNQCRTNAQVVEEFFEKSDLFQDEQKIKEIVGNPHVLQTQASVITERAFSYRFSAIPSTPSSDPWAIRSLPLDPIRIPHRHPYWWGRRTIGSHPTGLHPMGSHQEISRATGGMDSYCCSTVYNLTAPATVTSLVTNAVHSLVPMGGSYQIVHEAACAGGGGCGPAGRGTCTLEHRLQWLLVQVPGGSTFHPVQVGARCRCLHAP